MIHKPKYKITKKNSLSFENGLFINDVLIRNNQFYDQTAKSATKI